MKKEKEVRKETTERELELLEKLRQHPEILARVDSILEIASSTEGPLKTADEVEELLVQEIRQLGNVTMLEPLETAEEQSPVRNGHRYLTHRTECLDYPRAIKLGLPIGSGMIESGHRHVLHARLKKAGTAWLKDTADPIAHLRVLRSNRLWLSFWN